MLSRCADPERGHVAVSVAHWKRYGEEDMSRARLVLVTTETAYGIANCIQLGCK